MEDMRILWSLINLNRNYMYKDRSYLGSKLPQVTFSKRNKHCSFRLVEEKKNKSSACFIQGRTQGYKVRLSSNVLIHDENLIFQDALDTVKN